MSNIEKISAVVYQTEQGGTVTLAPHPNGGWKVDDTNTGRVEHLQSIPAFMAYCRANYSWPMPSSEAVN